MKKIYSIYLIFSLLLISLLSCKQGDTARPTINNGENFSQKIIKLKKGANYAYSHIARLNETDVNKNAAKAILKTIAYDITKTPSGKSVYKEDDIFLKLEVNGDKLEISDVEKDPITKTLTITKILTITENEALKFKSAILTTVPGDTIKTATFKANVEVAKTINSVPKGDKGYKIITIYLKELQKSSDSPADKSICALFDLGTVIGISSYIIKINDNFKNGIESLFEEV